jgi:hypothetical protein
MKYGMRILAIALLTAVAGCSDSPDMIYHDMVAFYNEILDTMLRTNDEETAKDVMAIQAKLYKSKFERLKDRREKRSSDLNQLEYLEWEEAYLDYYDEITATMERSKHAAERLQALIRGIKEKDSGATTTSLESVLNLPKTVLVSTGKGDFFALPKAPKKKK